MTATTTPGNTGYRGEHVDVTSTKPFDEVVADLRAELGTASTDRLMDRLAGSATWEEFSAECAGFAGRSNLIEVGFLDWGRVATLAGTPMRAKLFVLGNPLTARKLLAAGGPEVGLHLPTQMLVHEDAEGVTHVSYDRFGPIMAAYGKDDLDTVAGVIDGVLAGLAAAATA
ncbi:DUF302 domain-containing protein [Actinomycetospora chiangmaiensis]|uniref:DUF302 domain-containing protein n=1 Tax=Actinomycetospora chiangmaiensis TaxID=402650 RepID=UPI00037B118A|nr:DUF302 domain-containing protein [Actinomycetospora chiangmaiensis]